MSKDLEVNDQVPHFQVLVGEDKLVSPEDFKGKKLVIYFYPKDNTPGCTTETKEFVENYKNFQSENAEILGVSKDSLKSHKKFIDKLNIPFQLGSDPETKICEKFGVWIEKSMYGRKYMGIDRSTFLIDEAGKIIKIWRKVSVKGHVEEVLKEVSK
ncbi:MAG: peroxiredoxin [Rickettsiales bacterium]